MEQNGLIQSIDSFPNAYGEGIQLNLTPAATTALSSAGSIHVMFDGMNLPDGSRVEGFSQNLQLNNTADAGMPTAPAGMGKLVIQALFGEGKIESPALLAAIGDFNFLYFSGVLFLICVVTIVMASRTDAAPDITPSAKNSANSDESVCG